MVILYKKGSIYQIKDIKSIRKSMYLTLKDIRKLTGLSISTISAAERGISNPTLQTLMLISKALNIPLNELLDKD